MGRLHPGLTTIGITGTIGSGKSTVGKILKELGIPVIDSDQIVHELLAESGEVQQLVINRFGPRVVTTSSGSPITAIDRKALGRIVFQDSQARTDLERILHPRVREISYKRIERYANDPSVKLVGCLVPLLFEAGLGGEYDQTWTVVTDEPVLKDRLNKREHFSKAELEQRLALQWPQDKKASLADKVIDNSGNVEATRKQVLDLVNHLLATGTDIPPGAPP